MRGRAVRGQKNVVKKTHTHTRTHARTHAHTTQTTHVGTRMCGVLGGAGCSMEGQGNAGEFESFFLGREMRELFFCSGPPNSPTKPQTHPHTHRNTANTLVKSVCETVGSRLSYSLSLHSQKAVRRTTQQHSSSTTHHDTRTRRRQRRGFAFHTFDHKNSFWRAYR